MLRVKQIGLAIAELEFFTFGGILDLINTYIDEQEQMNSKKSNVRDATQTDIDKMFA